MLMRRVRDLYLSISRDLNSHLIVSLFVFIIIYVFFKSWKLAVLSFLSGILIDLDHLLDYFLVYRTKFVPEKFFCGFQFLKSRKVYVFLHGWEWIIAIVLIGFFAGKMRPAIAVAGGMFGHLAVDQILSFRREPFFYFFTYRFMHKFNLEVLDRKFKEKWNLN